MPDLCTLADVRAVLKKPTSETQDDGIIQTFATAASDEIARYTSREFVSTSATRRFRVTLPRDRYGLASVEMVSNDLRSIQGIVLDPQGTPSTINPANYVLSGGPDIIGTYTRILIARAVLLLGTVTWRTFGYSEVDISGTWGAASIPPIVVQAAAVSAAEWYRSKVAAFSTAFNDQGVHVQPAPLPTIVCGWLQPFLRYTA